MHNLSLQPFTNKYQYKMIEFVRKIVAGPKNRTAWNGIQLDLTYITHRIIAMAFPASGFEKTYRNSIHDVSQYLKEKHEGKCLVINVSMRKYDYSLFGNSVKEYFWPDHQAPPLTTIFQICYDMLKYLEKYQNGVVAVHCNHGKGRTGTCIISYMLFTKQFQSAEEALQFYNKRRFIVDTYGVDQPCQRRYLDYVEKMLRAEKIEKKLKAFKMVKIRQIGLDTDSHYLQISLTRNCQTKHSKLKLNQILKNNSIPLMADIFIEIYQSSWTGDKQIVRINFNMNFLQKSNEGLHFIEFQGKQICVNGKKNRDFTFVLFFSQFCYCHQKPNPDCECNEARELQEGKWNRMINIIEDTKKIPQAILEKYVGDIHSVAEQENGQYQEIQQMHE